LNQFFEKLLDSYQLNMNKIDLEILPEVLRMKLIELSKTDTKETTAAKSKITQIQKE
jgi:hypothetical protein